LRYSLRRLRTHQEQIQRRSEMADCLGIG
jgi:hypothetical protein